MCEACKESEIIWQRGMQSIMPALQEMAARLGLTIKTDRSTVIVGKYHEGSLYYYASIWYRRKWEDPTEWEYTLLRGTRTVLSKKERVALFFATGGRGWDIPVRNAEALLKKVEDFLTMLQTPICDMKLRRRRKPVRRVCRKK